MIALEQREPVLDGFAAPGTAVVEQLARPRPLWVAVVIPCYRVFGEILRVLAAIGPEVRSIYVVDDKCPQGSGDLVEAECRDPRVTVLRNPENLGVGGAVKAGYRAALADGADIVVKLDGDGQMDPALLPRLIAPIVAGQADYTKGNRFFAPQSLRGMPVIRLVGNAGLSFVSKIGSGYWDIMDPTNGYTAIHRVALARLSLDKIDDRYFFESDMLFRLATIRAVVRDVPMTARYSDEPSSLRISRVLFEFPPKHLRCIFKRVFYMYVLRDFNVASIQALAGSLLVAFGLGYGGHRWATALSSDVPAASGAVMLAALPTLLGFQLLLAALSYDVTNVPRTPLQGLFCEGQDELASESA